MLKLRIPRVFFLSKMSLFISKIEIVCFFIIKKYMVVFIGLLVDSQMSYLHFEQIKINSKFREMNSGLVDSGFGV